ncbi:DUF4430 domain-containing protein [Neobacillus cucumis]|uniref:Gram-positive cocci surface proteins LPxTG domain-containing protein n=1 Tax=Neobacillus cucumis TaxID=1740721 RepID=A0A2N5HNW4_9BACI|nr:DUF4430 domain-containing protein [Neobacillus cucumis]PLS07225.1 hypothetical protein CVD27_05975 [Neobacillus cucumis]
MLKRKNLWMSLLLVFMVLTSGLQTPVLAAEAKQGTVTVLGLDSTAVVPEKTLPLGEKETAAEALIDAVGKDNLEYTDTSYGPMLTGINGVKAGENQFWAFFINGISAQVGPDSYVLQNGDKVTFRLTDFTKPANSSVSLKILDDKKNTVAELSSIEVIGSPNAFQLLQIALGTDQVGFEETQYGKLITSIKGIKAEGSNYWAFYVDGKMAAVGAEGYQLQKGNQISFQLESYDPAPGDGGNGETTTPTTPTAPTTGTITAQDLQTAVNSSSAYVLKNEVGEWQVIALKQAGKEIPKNYLTDVQSVLKEKQGKFSRITDTERYALGILAAGGNPSNAEGFNLIEAIYNGNVTKQGLNGVAYALIALDSANFSVPSSAQWTKEKLISYLTDRQNRDGGWAWDESTTSDIDTTAMILTALAPFKDQAGVKEKVDAAIKYLSSQYQASKIDNSSTAAQVIIALSSLGIDSNTGDFSKDNSGLVQYLLSFQNKDGGFDWQGGDTSDPFTTSQGIQALVAYQLFTKEKGSLYHFNLPEETPAAETPAAKTPAVDTTKTPQPTTVVVETKTKTNSNTNTNSNTQTGHALPNTATNMYNLLAIGILLLIAGSYMYMRQRKLNA